MTEPLPIGGRRPSNTFVGVYDAPLAEEKQSEILARAQSLAVQIKVGEVTEAVALVSARELVPKLQKILLECSDSEIPHESIHEQISILSAYIESGKA